MKQISTARGAALWSFAEKHGVKQEVYFKYSGRLYSHRGKSYREARPTGKPGDYGFCNRASDAAWEQGGAWID